jgi:septal ring factor EnvC (AmiA/AmiB activator)
MYGWWKRAIFTASLVTLMAIMSVATIAWLRRPRAPRPVEPTRAPLLYNEVDGSVNDLNLKLEELEGRLLASEQRTQSLQAEVAQLKRERDAMDKRLKENDRNLARLRRQLEERATPRPRSQSTSPAGNAPPGANAPANAPEAPPDSSTGETPPIFPRGEAP